MVSCRRVECPRRAAFRREALDHHGLTEATKRMFSKARVEDDPRLPFSVARALRKANVI